MIFDFHAHVFPDSIALKASGNIGDFYEGVAMKRDGRVSSLLAAMDEGGIDRALIHSVALSAHQAPAINDFIISTVKKHPARFVGFASLYPGMENPGKELERALAAGLKGLKLHSDMQRVALDDSRMEPIYSACEGVCPLLLHMGDYRYHYDSPRLIPGVLKKHPRLTLICAHMGGYTEWDEAEKILPNENVFVDSSSSFFRLGADGMRRLISLYGASRVLFGTDYPMWEPGSEARLMLGLGLPARDAELIFHENARRLLGE